MNNTTTLWQWYNVANTFRRFQCNNCKFELVWKEMKTQDLFYCPHCGKKITAISNGKYYMMREREYQGKKYYDGYDPN